MGNLEQVDNFWLNQIKNGKSVDFDFVENLDDEDSFLRIVFSIINTQGGDILVGVNSKLKIRGVVPKNVVEKLEHLASENNICKMLEFHTLYIERFALVRVKVFQSIQKLPFLQNGNKRFYLRIGKEIILANKIILRLWRMQKEEKSFDCVEMKIQGKELMEFFLLNKKVTLSKLYNAVSFIKKDVDRQVACLLYYDKIAITTENGRIYYVLK